MWTLLALVVASVFYVLGGMAMKQSQAYEHLIPSLMVFVCFCIGSGIQTWTMKKADLGEAYVFVLGLESILAVLAGMIFFQETLTLYRAIGTLLVVIGIVFLKL